ISSSFFFFQAEDGIRDFHVTGVQTCALPISAVGERSVLVGARVVDGEELAVDVEHRDRGLDAFFHPHGLAERYVLRSTDEDHGTSVTGLFQIAQRDSLSATA